MVKINLYRLIILSLISLFSIFFQPKVLSSDIKTEVDINSWSVLVGQVTQNTCLYSQPNLTSKCIKKLSTSDMLSALFNKETGDFISTNYSYMNPNFDCSIHPTTYQMSCNGKPFIEIPGFVNKSFFKYVRYRSSCDDYDSVYLNEPRVSCYGNRCSVEVGLSSLPSDGVRVEVEINTYDRDGKRIRGMDETETSYYSSNVTVDFDLNDEVRSIKVTDVDCEKW